VATVIQEICWNIWRARRTSWIFVSASFYFKNCFNVWRARHMTWSWTITAESIKNEYRSQRKLRSFLIKTTIKECIAMLSLIQWLICAFIVTFKGEVMTYLRVVSPVSIEFWYIFKMIVLGIYNEHTKPNSIEPTDKRPRTSWLYRFKQPFSALPSPLPFLFHSPFSPPPPPEFDKVMQCATNT